MNLIIQTDGASRGNPGEASYGYLIKEKSSGVILHQEGQKIGIATNNIAEYTAVLRAFQYIKAQYSHKSPHRIWVLADSQLVIRQLAGFYKIKNPNLKIIYHQIKALEEGSEIEYIHVPREENFIADRLANKALDEE